MDIFFEGIADSQTWIRVVALEITKLQQQGGEALSKHFAVEEKKEEEKDTNKIKGDG